MLQKHNYSTLRAFTLAELLVVIAIITLLVAILLPVLAKTRMAAQSVECMSNESQIAIAIQLYADDHEHYVPPMISDTSSRRWPAILHHGGYISGSISPSGAIPQGVFSCPAASSPPPHAAAWYGTNYGLNGYYFNNWYSAHTYRQGRFFPFGFRYRSGSSIKFMSQQPPQPQKVALLGDTSLFVGDSAAPRFFPQRAYNAGLRHNQSINVLYFDLHVAPKKITDIDLVHPTHEIFWYDY